jgi:hypothetical protein
MRTLALLLVLAAACTEETGATESAVGLGDIDVTCGPGLVILVDTEYEQGGEYPIATQTVTVAAGETKYVDAQLVGKQVNSDGDDDILQSLRLQCTGPVQERIKTTQNDLRGGSWLTTDAHLVLETPGTYTCVLSASTSHHGARLEIGGKTSCIVTVPTPALDFPANTDEEKFVGEGQIVKKGETDYVMWHHFDVDPASTSVDFHGDIELTDINGANNSGTSIAECTRPDTNYDPAYARVHIEAAQLASSGTCGGWVASPNTDVTISARTHHQKLHLDLTRQMSHAANCLPAFWVRTYIVARSGGNDLCFHGARYSNFFAFPH